MKKRLLYLALALFGAPLLWGQSTVVCTTSAPGTVVGSCAGGGVATSDTPVTWTGVHTFNNAANTPVTAADGVIDSTLTAGRVTFAGAAGRLSDDADLTFATATLTGTNIVGGTSNCSVGGPGTANSVCLGSGVVSGEGSTGGDGFQTNVSFGDATADNQLQLTGTATGLDMTATTGSLRVHLGTGTGRGSLGGVICKGVGIATTGTSEEVLATCTIPANTLSADGASIRVSFLAYTAANANNKRLRLRVGGLGGTVVMDTGAVALNNKNISSYGPVVITRNAATTFTSYAAVVDVSNASLAAGSISPYIYMNRAGAGTWANANDLVFTGLTATAAADLTLGTYLVEVVQ